MLVPELICSDIAKSVHFYVQVLGFSITYERRQERFVHLEREGAAVMIEQPTTRLLLAGDLEHPYGRGMNLQVEVSDVEALYLRVRSAEAVIYMDMEEKWYRANDKLLGNKQFMVADPDGYLLRFFQNLGERPLSSP